MHAHTDAYRACTDTYTTPTRVCVPSCGQTHSDMRAHTHLCIDIDPIGNLLTTYTYRRTHVRMQAQEQAPAHTNALARNTYKRGCVHARPRVSVSTQQRHSALRRTGKCVRFPFLRSLQVPRRAARTQVSSLPESIGNCRKLQSLCAAPAPAHHAWCCRRARACSPFHVVMHVSTGLL